MLAFGRTFCSTARRNGESNCLDAIVAVRRVAKITFLATMGARRVLLRCLNGKVPREPPVADVDVSPPLRGAALLKPRSTYM